MQIIADHESRGENILPVDVLNDLVRSYMLPGGGMMPEFLSNSFEMLRENQTRMVEKMSAMNPLAQMPGFEAMKAQQEAFLKAMTGGMGGMATGWPGSTKPDRAEEEKGEDLDEIKQQLAELQDKLSKLR